MSHYQEDYTALVADLLANYPEEEAMARAVGGDFTGIGGMEVELLTRYGLKPGMTLVDMGCGSGRLTAALVRQGWDGVYAGFDVVPELVAYARKQGRETWYLNVSDGLHVPLSVPCDFIVFFSVFTHLKPEESYVYLEQAHKALKPGGRVLASYLDYAKNWDVFDAMCHHVRSRIKPVHLNTFLHRDSLTLFASKVGFRLVDFGEAPALGQQSLIVLEK